MTHRSCFGTKGGYGSAPFGCKWVQGSPGPRYRAACIVAVLRLRRVGVTVVHTARLLHDVLACSSPRAKTVFVDPPYQRAGQDGGRCVWDRV